MIKYTLTFLKSHKIQLTKFVAVGLISFCVYFSFFHLCYGVARIDYKLAASLAYIITVISHFLLHRAFTFGARAQKMVHGIWKYLLMLAFNYLTMLTVMWIFVDIIEGSPYLAVIVSTAFTSLFNFFVMKYFVFHLRDSDPLTI